LYLLFFLHTLKTKEQLIKGATRLTGFKDFGFDKHPKWLEGFNVALAEAPCSNLTLSGRRRMNFLFFRRLVERLRFVDFVKNHPELEQIQIKNPIFIIGLPRTGSTITFNLLALDKSVRTLKLWEVINPTPPPSDSAPYSRRIRRIKFALAFQRLWSPELDKLHYVRAELPEEETVWFSQNNWFPGLTIGVMSKPIQEWFLQQEDKKKGENALQMYADFRNLLRMRIIGSENPSRWLFKGVLIHQPCLHSLFRIFPDARIVYLRRDPCETVGSALSLETTIGKNYQNLDFKKYGPQRVPMFISLEESMQNYRRSLAPEFEKNHFVDISYKDIVANPFECVQKVYEQFGLEFTEEYATKMRQYLTDNPQGKHGKHSYNLKSYGLTDQIVNDAFKPIYGDTT